MATITGELPAEAVSKYERRRSVFYSWTDQELKDFVIAADNTQLKQLIELLAQAEKDRGPS